MNVSRYKLFCDLILNDISKDSVVVEIGAGKGLCKHVAKIRNNVKVLLGVDPSDNIEVNPYVHKRIKQFFEDAEIESESVDLIYSIYVMEHIEKPEKVIEKAYNILKKGGKMYFITPNRKHYFVCISKIAESLRFKKIWIEKFMHLKVNTDLGFESYYYLNDEVTIKNLSEKYKFKTCSIIFIDSPRDIARYLPNGFKWLPYLISSIMQGLGISKRYSSDIIVRMEK